MFCRHKNQTTPRHDSEGEYRRCLGCGARIAWQMPGEPLPPPRLTQPSAAQVSRVWQKLFEGDPHLSVAERIAR